jgi:glucose/arabinose dehydrogenase
MGLLLGGRRARALVTLAFIASLLPASTGSAAPPPDWAETTVFSGLTNPTAIEFAPDGRVFIAEKSGLIKVFQGLSDTTPHVFADLRTNVHNFWDRGLLGLALDPNWATNPTVYALYTHDAVIGGTAPRWGTAGVTGDPCPNPPGATGDGCVVSGRLSKMTVGDGGEAGPEQVLIEDWCQQYPSHSVGSLDFGADGALYVSAGDGASFSFADYGQRGNPANPCGDPPVGEGGTQTPPTAEGGALRSQDLRTTSDPMSLDGTIVRVDPQTGTALPDNPMATSSDPNTRRVVATGLRNPFRMTIRPGTNEVWFGDVGSGAHEEIDRIPNPTDATVENFGWPCYEGPARHAVFDNLDLGVCENLYGEPSAHAQAHYSYSHSAQVVPGEPCPSGTSSTAGIAFYEGGRYPEAYDGALFFADYSRDCIWVMFERGGQPDPSTRATFVGNAANPVDLTIGPNGDLFYVDFGGTVRRIKYTAEPPAPPPAPGGPDASIDSPGPGKTWKVGDQIAFSGSATDPEDGTLPASALSWAVVLQHCPSGCHAHTLQTFEGVASASVTAPDHEYPSHLELRLTATDTAGYTDTESFALQPQTVRLTFETSPQGGQIRVGGTGETAPFTRTVIVGSQNSIGVPSPQTINGLQYTFDSWSDGGARAHEIIAPATPTTYLATLGGESPASPVISDVDVSKIRRTRATVTWTTNEPATSQLEYGRTTEYGKFTRLDPSLVASHEKTIKNLRRNRVYHFRVHSVDAEGNSAASADFKFRTRR